MHLKLQTEVSDVDPARSVTVGGSIIPGLTSRQSETTVRLLDGQSFAIAGLLSDRVRSTIQRIPFLGDLPILGALFRSVSYQRDESELLVVVTAHLAKPVAPHDAPRLPTDNELNDPNDIQLFLFGSEAGGSASHSAGIKESAGKARCPGRQRMSGPGTERGARLHSVSQVQRCLGPLSCCLEWTTRSRRTCGSRSRTSPTSSAPGRPPSRSPTSTAT